MGNKDFSKLRSLLKTVRLPAPSQQFTARVMGEIEEEEANRAHAEDRLKALLQKQRLHVPPADFTHKVVNALRRQPSLQVYEPVITAKGWALTGLFVIIYVTVAVVKEEASAQAVRLIFPFSFGEFLSGMVQQFKEALFYSGIVILSAGLLLTLDYFLNKIVNERHPRATD